jgi:hypothetical protein
MRVTDQDERRAAAIRRRLSAKRAFAIHAALFVAVDILLCGLGPDRGRIFLADLAVLRVGVAVALTLPSNPANIRCYVT